MPKIISHIFYTSVFSVLGVYIFFSYTGFSTPGAVLNKAKAIDLTNILPTNKSKNTDTEKLEDNNITKIIQVLYYFNENSNLMCSGLKDGANIITSNHCLQKDFKDIAQDGVVTDSNVLSKNVFLRTDLVIKSNIIREFSIATVDKGVVGASDTNAGCVDDKCLFFKVKSYKSLGQGNSGTPMFDYAGDYAGALSYMHLSDTYSCDIISYIDTNNNKVEDFNRNCSFDLVFNTSENFRNKMLKK